MAPRQELVSSAVTFLSDPSVSSSPLDKRIEFLKSKNLTQEEITLALSQADASTAAISPSQSLPTTPQSYYPQSPQQATQYPPAYAQAYSPYGTPYPPLPLPPPPDPPRRDWRDYFILATVVTGASYSLLFLANRYIKPLIAPPTPPQIEQDKAAIDAQFERAFALLDTLTDDTAKLKAAEEERTKRLDSTIEDIESIVSELKAANLRREDDSRRIEAEVKNMKDSLPRALDSVRDANDKQLKELAQELGSLKALIGNRMGTTSSSSYTPPSVPRAPQANLNAYTSPASRPQQAPAPAPAQAPTQVQTQDFAPGSTSNPTGVNSASTAPSYSMPSTNAHSAPLSTATGTTSNANSATGIPAGSASAARPAATNLGYGANKLSIPAWQLAAQKSVDAKTNGEKNEDGADAMAALAQS